MTFWFKEEDCGCYIDGVRGYPGIYLGLAHMAGELARRDIAPEMKKRLCTWADDLDKTIVRGQRDEANECADEITDMLQQLTVDGLTWIWDAGDLLLLKADEADP